MLKFSGEKGKVQKCFHSPKTSCSSLQHSPSHLGSPNQSDVTPSTILVEKAKLTSDEEDTGTILRKPFKCFEKRGALDKKEIKEIFCSTGKLYFY